MLDPNWRCRFLHRNHSTWVQRNSFGKCVCVCMLKKDMYIEHVDAILARRSLSFHLNLPLSTASIASQLFDNQQPLIGRPVAL